MVTTALWIGFAGVTLLLVIALWWAEYLRRDNDQLRKRLRRMEWDREEERRYVDRANHNFWSDNAAATTRVIPIDFERDYS